MPSFATSSQCAKIGLSERILYVENYSDFFLLKIKGLGANFLLKLFFDNFNLKITFLMKSGSIFEEVAKLGKASCDAYNWGRWLIS